LVVTGLSLSFWAIIKEPKYELPVKQRSVREYLAHLKSILRRQTEYRKFLIVRIILNLCEVATPFFGVYANIRFEMRPGVFGTFTMVLLVAQGASTLMWGYIGDRWGFKPVLQIAASFGVLAAVLALTAPRYEFFFIVYALIGAMFSAALISNMNLGIEFSEPGETPTYVGLLNSAQAIPLAVAPLIGGAVADLFNYRVTIGLGLALFSFALVYVTMFMTDPRKLLADKQ
jgi:MFS family permease